MAEYKVIDLFSDEVVSDREPWDHTRASIIDINTETWAWYYGLFANVTWNATEWLQLRGMRYSSTRREMVDASLVTALLPCLSDVRIPRSTIRSTPATSLLPAL